jgi:oligoendopeptidase F
MLQIEKKERKFLEKSLLIETWDTIKPYFDNLADREISCREDLLKWFQDRSELESAISENMGWRYIKMTGDTGNQDYVNSFNFFVEEIQPNIAPYSNKLDQKALNSPFLSEIGVEGYSILKKLLEKDSKLFRETNIPLLTEISTEEQIFGSVSGAMTVEVDGDELTLQQATQYLQSNDRGKREEVYRKIAERRYLDKDRLDDLYDKLRGLRHQVARNSDFENYRDYMHNSLGRFEYTPEDCFEFHNAVQKQVVPILNDLAKERKEKLNLDELRPWDLNVNCFGTTPLKPFNSGEDLLSKTLACFNKINPYLGECLATMNEMGHLDLVSRKGKAPGGYNYPLDETGVPFIFMNATSTLNDLVTMVHEGGHALHSFLTRDLALNSFKNPPSEVAELASMSMELISMEFWDTFFDNEKDLIRAKREHLEGIIATLPWVATIDKFQHWLYENPNHSTQERINAWNEIYSGFSNSYVNWAGLEKYKDYVWQKQLHIYEVPFYYIEYGIAQLGAVAVWKNYKENPEVGFNKYIDALKLGYTKSIREIYTAAGIKFDFSESYIQYLMDFVRGELAKLELS